MQNEDLAADVNRPFSGEKVSLRADVQFWGKLNLKVPQKRSNSGPLIDIEKTSEANADSFASVAILEAQEEYELGSVEEVALSEVLE